MKLKRFFGNQKLFWLWGLALSALLAYGAYSFRYEFLDWSNLPLVGFYGVLCGVCFALAFLLLRAQAKKPRLILSFFASLAVFEAVLWGVLTLVNVDGKYNERAVGAAFAVLFAMYGAVLFAAFFKLGKTVYRPFYRALAALCCVAALAGAAQPVLKSPAHVYKLLAFTSDVSFRPLTAAQGRITDEERSAARTWFEEHVLYGGSGAPAFDFKLDGVSFSEHTGDWEVLPSALSTPARGDGQEIVSFKHKHSGLVLTVSGRFYEPYAAMEWTVFLKNRGNENSPVISDFYALTRISDLPLENAALYCSGGSRSAADDFTLYRVRRPALAHTFSGTGGRPTDEYMPYFNLCGERWGVVVGVGWTGQWQAKVSCGGKGAGFYVRQQNLKAYLAPGEQLRSPLASLSVYAGGNPVKGFNAFRRWVVDCVYPENTPYVLNDLDVLFVSHTRTAAEIRADVDAYPPALYDHVDNLWMDAGWYDGCRDDWSDGNGNWVTNEARFPQGIKEISDLAKEKGAGLVLWYEPERLVHGSRLYALGERNPRYMIDLDPADEGNQSILWNLAEDEACAYLTMYISSSLKENGVSVYRQDFNISPLEYWAYADEHYYDGRVGYCENRYVANLYKYLDGLFAEVPGLIMDNCASGGRRLDLEMARRGVPLWRTDYNCSVHPDSLEADQAHTYGLSFWLPVSGANVDLSTEYAARSSIFGGNLFTADSVESPWFGKYEAERALLVKNFYPISFGGVGARGVTAMQYGDDAGGMALVYKHEKARAGAYAVVFSGLEENAVYRVWDEDDAASAVTLTGRELMDGAFGITLPGGKKAAMVKYRAA